MNWIDRMLNLMITLGLLGLLLAMAFYWRL